MKRLKEDILRLIEEDKEFRYAVAGLIGYKEVLDRIVSLEEKYIKLEEELAKLREDMVAGFKRHDEEFAKVWQELAKLREDMNSGFKRLEIIISSIGARWGIMNEQSVRNVLKGIIGKELGYSIKEWNHYDDEGYVYGYPSNVQLDVVISDSKTIVLEISSHVRRSDPITILRKVELYKRLEHKTIDKIMVVTPFIEEDAKEACKKFGIEIYSI